MPAMLGGPLIERYVDPLATSVKIVVALFMLQVSLLELILAPLACPDSGIRPRPCSSFG